MNDIRKPGDTSDASETTGTAVAAETSPSVEDLQRERDEYKDLLLRKTAEFDNFRKRTERERQAVTEAAAADLIEDMLPILDDLERAIEADPQNEAAEAYRDGVRLIHKRLLELLQKRGVRPIEAVGADFDPHYHEAVVHEPAPGHREGEILEEYRRGYMLGDRLLRASMVKVAKGES